MFAVSGTPHRRAKALLACLAVLALLAPTSALASGGGSSSAAATAAAPKPVESAVFFTADGLRQDIVARYAKAGGMPTMARFMQIGAVAAGNGILTQAPPNTGAGWYTLATGAWPGVHGSTNNTFHINGAPFATSTAAFGAGVLQAETIAQSAERAGLKVAQIEWAGGRNGLTNGPTIDFRTFFSGRGVTTNFISPTDDPAFTAAFGLQFDHPAGFAGQPAFAEAARAGRAAVGWTNVPTSNSPAMQMRMRVVDFGVDKYPLNAYIYDFDQQRPGRLRPRPVLADEEWRRQGRRPSPGRVGRRQGQDRRRRARRTDGRDARQGGAAERRPVPGPAVPHLGQPGHRVVADLAGRGGLQR